jgi:hypothetical protein
VTTGASLALLSQIGLWGDNQAANMLQKVYPALTKNEALRDLTAKFISNLGTDTLLGIGRSFGNEDMTMGESVTASVIGGGLGTVPYLLAGYRGDPRRLVKGLGRKALKSFNQMERIE